MVETEITRRAVNQEEAARLLGVSLISVHRMCLDGRLASFNVGRARRIPLRAIEELMGYPVMLESEHPTVAR